MRTATIDRATLYARVWDTPLRRLAPTYGITDVALKKACARLGVPTPPRGYWAKRRHGHDVPRPPLPPPAPGAPTSYTVRIPDPGERPAPASPTDRVPLPPALDPPPAVEVVDELQRLTPLVRATRTALKGSATDTYGRLYTHRAPLDIEVSPQTLPRALRIADAFLRAAQAVGFGVETPPDGGRAHLVVDGERVPFGLQEPSRKEAVPVKERRSSWDTVRYRPSGDLHLRFGTSYSGYARAVRDTKTKRLEDRLGPALVEVYHQAQRQREAQARLEAARIERERAADERRRLEHERAVEAARRTRLEDQAANWRRSQEVVAFVDAVEARAATRPFSDDERTAFDAWLQWAREHAARLDPLAGALPHEFSPPHVPRRLYF